MLFVLNIQCFVVMWKLLLVRHCFVVWPLFSVFSIFCVTSFSDCTFQQHQEITQLSEPNRILKKAQKRLSCSDFVTSASRVTDA